MASLARFSSGVGDRFGQQAAAQLRAFQKLERDGCLEIPVWNKSNREYSFIGSEPASVRAAAERAVQQCDWKHAWHVDADHIRFDTVNRFLDSSDFFKIDVADSIGSSASRSDLDAFVARHPDSQRLLDFAGLPFHSCFLSLDTYVPRALELSPPFCTAHSPEGAWFSLMCFAPGGDVC